MIDKLLTLDTYSTCVYGLLLLLSDSRTSRLFVSLPMVSLPLMLVKQGLVKVDSRSSGPFISILTARKELDLRGLS